MIRWIVSGVPGERPAISSQIAGMASRTPGDKNEPFSVRSDKSSNSDDCWHNFAGKRVMTDNADLPPELNLPLPRQDQYSTWEVLKHEFNLLHGMSGWNPDPLPGETTREDMIADACRNGVLNKVAATETAT